MILCPFSSYPGVVLMSETSQRKIFKYIRILILLENKDFNSKTMDVGFLMQNLIQEGLKALNRSPEKTGQRSNSSFE